MLKDNALLLYKMRDMIVSLRKCLDLTQKDFAYRLGVKTQKVIDWENKDILLSVQDGTRLVQLLYDYRDKSRENAAFREIYERYLELIKRFYPEYQRQNEMKVPTNNQDSLLDNKQALMMLGLVCPLMIPFVVNGLGVRVCRK